MSENALSQSILEEITGLSARFNRVEIGLSDLDGRMSGLEGQVSSLAGQVSKLAGQVSPLDGHLSRLEARVSGVEGQLSGLSAHMTSLENRMSTIEDVVAALHVEIKTWPDMHFLGSAVKAQLGYSREMRSEIGVLGVRIKEIFHTMATDPEIQHLRDEVSRFRQQSLGIDVRLGAVEGRPGIKEKLEPY